MDFKILTGLDINEDFLETVMDLDEVVYSSKYVGEIDNMIERFRANPDSFVCIYDEKQDRLVGYINFFPCTKELYRNIRYETDVIRDDDIAASEIAQYSDSDNHLFILSLAIHPDYQGEEAITALSDAWISYLNNLIKRGHQIADISAIAVSEDGQKALRNYMFAQERFLEDENIVYICEGKALEKLLNHDLYFKSYKSDVYLMLPLADNVRNHRMDELFQKKTLKTQK